MLQFTNTKTATTIEAINEVEKLVGLTFPEDYKKHLLKHNGGRCEPNVFEFSEYYESGEPGVSSVDWFYALYDGEYNNFVEYIHILKIDEKRMPQHMVPIAHDSLGNEICISCREQDYGHVYFWDHECEVDYTVSDDNDYSNLYFIANSFTAFLNGLKEYSDDE